MKNIKPFGPSIGITKISNKFFDKLNKEFNTKSKSKKIDYSSKLASQIKNELKISDKFIKKNLEKEIKMKCVFINKFDSWIPVEISKDKISPGPNWYELTKIKGFKVPITLVCLLPPPSSPRLSILISVGNIAGSTTANK